MTRKPIEELDLLEGDAPESENESRNIPRNEPKKDSKSQILEISGSNPNISYDELADQMQKGRSTIMRYIAELKTSGHLKRIGPKKGGCWELIE